MILPPPPPPDGGAMVMPVLFPVSNEFVPVNVPPPENVIWLIAQYVQVQLFPLETVAMALLVLSLATKH